MTHTAISLTRTLVLVVGFCFTPFSFAANTLPPEPATELGKLYQAYSAESQAAIAVRKQAELLQTEIATQQSFVTELQGKADRAETELSELQEFDRKKPGKVKPEEMDAARSKHLQARSDVEGAQRKFAQQQAKLTQLKEDLSKKNLATEHSVSAYQARFEALAKEAVTRRVNALKVPQQITESASIPCEDLPLKECKIKTQQEVQRRAIEKGGIIVVDSLTEIKNLKLEKDEVKSEVHGELSNLKILDTKLTDEPATYAMKIQATVTPAIGNSLLSEINRTVRADMSLQVSDGGLAIKGAEANALVENEATASNVNESIAEALRGKGFDARLKKAKAGNAQAKFEIALMYEFGLGVKQDPIKAAEWYDKAVSLGHVIAQAGLARAYRYGRGVTKDEHKAAQLTSRVLPELEKLAIRGEPIAQFELSFLYGYGYGVEKDESKLLSWLEKAAMQGYAFFQRSLGLKFENGMGVPKDLTKAFKWYEKAALQGDAPAQFFLGSLYMQGAGVEKNESTAFQWYEKAAIQGYSLAQQALGDMYKDGVGVEKDEHKAFEWYDKASFQPDVQNRVCSSGNYTGIMFLVDHRFAEDDKDYKKAIDTKSAAARWFNKAFKWCERAAKSGDMFSQNTLGEFYLDGRGVGKNLDKAYTLFEKSAQQGLSSSQSRVGQFYKAGAVVGKDLVLAYAWLNLAAAQGDDEAQKIRDGITLSAGQRAEAERLSSQWKPGKLVQRGKRK